MHYLKGLNQNHQKIYHFLVLAKNVTSIMFTSTMLCQHKEPFHLCFSVKPINVCECDLIYIIKIYVSLGGMFTQNTTGSILNIYGLSTYQMTYQTALIVTGDKMEKMERKSRGTSCSHRDYSLHGKRDNHIGKC